MSEDICPPKLTGKFGVSRTFIQMIDDRRIDPNGDGSSPRKLVVCIWYPTDQEHSLERYDRYSIKYWKTLHNWKEKRPNEKIFSKLASYSTEDQQLSKVQREYPLMIFSHGFGNVWPTLYSCYIEEIASHGFIVAGIFHTHNAAFTIDKDQIIPGKMVDHIPTIESLSSEHTIWVSDFRFVLSMFKGSKVRFFEERIDPKKIIYAGHSFGGSVATHEAMFNREIAAAINMDGPIFGTYPIEKIKTPLLVLVGKENDEGRHDDLGGIENTIQKLGVSSDVLIPFKLGWHRLNNLSGNITLRIMNDIAHAGFCDFAFLAPTLFPQYSVGKNTDCEPITRVRRELLSFIKGFLIDTI